MAKRISKITAIILIAVVAVVATAGIVVGIVLFRNRNKATKLSTDEKGAYYLDADGNKVYKLVMMDHGVPFTTDQFKYRQQVLDALNEKLLKDLGYKIDITTEVYSDDTFSDKLATKLADGDQLDLVRQVDRTNLTSYVEQRIAKKITPYVNAAKNMRQTLPERIFDEVTYNGEIYAIPLDKLPVNSAAFVRGDLMEKAGVTSLSTMEEWENFLKTIKDGGTDYLNTRLEPVPLMGGLSDMEDMFLGSYTTSS